MIGPLWGFFHYIKDKSPIPLAIDQYFHFVHAIERGEFESLERSEDLLAFTKVFWLNDPNYAPQYEYAFFTFFDRKQLIKPEYLEDRTQSERQEKKIREIKDKIETDTNNVVNVDSDKEKSTNDNTGIVEQTLPQDEMVDFKLVLKESDRAGDDQNDMFKDYVKHNFILSDSAIMPFDVRNFSQRIRRKVETADQVVSDELDARAMVKDFVENGFIEEIKYELADASHSNIVLLSDRFGSMLAYEYMDDLFRDGFSQIPHCQFEHYFFYNLPKQDQSQNHYLLKQLDSRHAEFNTANHKWHRNTWFFILSDAGAHSGVVNRDRMKYSRKFWKYFNAISDYVYWINPVPFEFLNDSTAKRLQMTIPMVYPSEKNLNKMINLAKAI